MCIGMLFAQCLNVEGRLIQVGGRRKLYKLGVQLKNIFLPSSAGEAGRSLWAQLQDGQQVHGD